MWRPLFTSAGRAEKGTSSEGLGGEEGDSREGQLGEVYGELEVG